TIANDVRDNFSLRNDLIALGLDPEKLQQSGTLSLLALDFQRSTADSLLNASKGYQLALHVEKAGTFLPGTFTYVGTSADVRQYQPVGERLVCANRFLFGNIAEPAGTFDNVPFGKKYFLGGATAMRGWGRFEVSPLGAGTPIGGDSTFYFGTELRAMLHGN